VKSELRQQAALAVPLAAQQMGLMMLGMVDAAILGRYDSDALGASGIANALVFGISCIGMGIVMGLDALVPQAIGAGRHGEARWLLRDGLALALWVGIPLSLLVAASPVVLHLADVDPGITHHAERYIWTRAIGVMLFLVQVTLRAFLQAHGVTRPLVTAVIVSNVVNLFGDWILVFGDEGLNDLGLPSLGLPALGVIGAALATVFVQLMNCVLYAVAVRGVLAGLPQTPRTSHNVRRILRLGLPVGLQLAAEVGAFAIASVLAGRLGKLPADGHTVALNVSSFSFSIALGIGAATAVRVGNAVGAGDHRLARRRGATGFGMGALVMTTSAIVFIFWPEVVARLLTDDEHVIAAAVPLLRVAAVFQLSDGAQAIAAGALRGAGDTHAAFLANVVGHYGVGIPIAIVCAFPLDMGAVGLWWGLSAGLTATAIGLVLRFRRLTSRTIALA
jgi:multidrug resistance protein, MATE family